MRPKRKDEETSPALTAFVIVYLYSFQRMGALVGTRVLQMDEDKKNERKKTKYKGKKKDDRPNDRGTQSGNRGIKSN